MNNRDPNFVDINQIDYGGGYAQNPNEKTVMPIGLNLNDFLPKEPVRAAKVPESRDIPIMSEIRELEGNFLDIMKRRVSLLDQVRVPWDDNRKTEAFQEVAEMKDLGVTNDVFNFAFLHTDLKRIELRASDAIIVLPEIIKLASSPYDSYFKHGIFSAWIVLKLFYEVILNTKGCVAVGQGLDLNREDKLKKYDIIIDYLTKVRNLSELSRRIMRKEQIEGLNLQKFVTELDYFLRKCQQYSSY